MKWITYDWLCASDSGLTSIWDITSRESGVSLGRVFWYARWRKYVFSPMSRTVFEEDCLRDIAEFCESRTRAHRDARTGR